MSKKSNHSPHSPHSLAPVSGAGAQHTPALRPLCNKGGRVSVCTPLPLDSRADESRASDGQMTVAQRLAAMAKMPKVQKGEPWPPRSMQLPSLAELLRLSKLTPQQRELFD